MGALVGNPIIVAEIDLMYCIILLQILNFPEISDETPKFLGNLAI